MRFTVVNIFVIAPISFVLAEVRLTWSQLWPPCQAPGVIESVLGLVFPVSV